MDKKGILRVLGPGLAAAFVVLLIGLLVTSSEWNADAPAAGPGKPPGGASPGGKRAMVAMGDANDAGMSDSLPPTDAPEWKDIGDGLKMWDVKLGEGDADCPGGATVTIHYTGWNLNGSVFDSSRTGGGKAAEFPLGRLVKGWQLGIPGMKPGGIRRLLIPGPLAYGERGSPPKIGPNATLVFEIKLLGFN